MWDNPELMDSFLRICRLMHRSHHQRNCGAGKESFPGQGRVLGVLKSRPGVSQKELARLLDMRPQSVGEILGKLERNGYLTRSANALDQRMLCVSLTPEGMLAADCMRRGMLESTKLFDCLRQEEKEDLGQYLARIIQELERDAALETRPET